MADNTADRKLRYFLGWRRERFAGPKTQPTCTGASLRSFKDRVVVVDPRSGCWAPFGCRLCQWTSHFCPGFRLCSWVCLPPIAFWTASYQSCWYEGMQLITNFIYRGNIRPALRVSSYPPWLLYCAGLCTTPFLVRSGNVKRSTVPSRIILCILLAPASTNFYLWSWGHSYWFYFRR